MPVVVYVTEKSTPGEANLNGFLFHIVYPVRSNGTLDESLVHLVLRSERGNHILVRMCTLLSMVQHLLHLWESIARVHLWAPFWSSIHCGRRPRDG